MVLRIINNRIILSNILSRNKIFKRKISFSSSSKAVYQNQNKPLLLVNKMRISQNINKTALLNKNLISCQYLLLRNKSDKALKNEDYPQRIFIGSTSKEILEPKLPSLVPILYCKNPISQTELGHLQWMLKKDLLGQDMFLLGSPGPMRRQLAMAFAEITSREVEYISLSRDTTESDMKQRREVLQKTAKYIDQAAVRAAVEGRLLIIEGIEKAERNVLPLLNNLLENREMNLEDGRHLIAHERYDKLLQEHGIETLEEKWKLVRVNENFRVIALGLPVPFFKGNPLDPPLRSRFQGRNIVPETTDEMLHSLQTLTGDSSLNDKLKILNNFAYSVVWSNDPDFRNSEENPWAMTLPHFPIENLNYAALVLKNTPQISLYRLLSRMYPYELVLDEKEEGELIALEKTFEKFGFSINKNLPAPRNLPLSEDSSYTPIQTHESVVSEILESYSAKRDIAIIGDRGIGKSACINRFSGITGHKVEPIVLYKDMTARDLLQQRATKLNGDTIWYDSPLVTSALEGNLVVLDGLDRVHSSTLAVIHRLVHDRELQLYDGKRLLSQERYNELKERYGYTYHQLNEEQRIFPIHPDFYMIASGTRPLKSGAAKNKKQWLTPEMLSLFFYHELPEPTMDEEIQIITTSLKNKILHPDMKKIVKVARELRNSKENSKKSLSFSLSTRQLCRIAKRSEVFGQNSKEISAFDEISKACLSRFLPTLNREELESSIKKNGIFPTKNADEVERKIEISRNNLRIGDTVTQRWPDTEYKSKVPHVLFYNIQQHIRVLEELLKDYLLGEHLLLVGNQGVGKNKLVDQLLYLLNRPREYIQLHRDTTVQSLTLQQKVVDGVVKFEDSPLIRAARDGHIIIIDEADKAPTHVTCILKTLAESGEMILSDGRRIVPESIIKKHYRDASPENIIPLHKNFKMFVLANRPGFPFLGNDFYSVLGDLFSVHAIDNPNFDSELELLKQYAPDINEDYLKRIAMAFQELRNLSDEGTINYPYSTREAVNIVKHLQKYPNDSISEAIDNIFDFDVYNWDLRQAIKETLKKYRLEPSEGVLLRKRTTEGRLEMQKISVKELEKLQGGPPGSDMNPFLKSDKDFKPEDFADPKFGKTDSTNAPHVGGNQWAGGSGGRGTAGLGGAGGPYRLDSGNAVFQVADYVKEAVPAEVRKMAREMARKAFEEKLKEIKMSQYEGNIYEQFLAPIRPQIQALRVILTSLQAKAKERRWVKHQTSGEMDDSKIIESVVGEKTVYKLRKDEEPEPGDPQEKPKRLKLVVDCSGSMYRFNGYDKRMDRMLECALLVMESFQGFDDIFKYEIVGHSGDDFKLSLASKDTPPKDNKERIDIMKMMHLHSQFCSSGDNTLEATEDAIKSLADEIEDCDEGFVIVLSDANLERYGIPAKDFTKILNMNSEVKAFAIFVGSLGDQAERLTKELPSGRAYVCMDTSKLPQILQRIFTQTILA